MKIFKYKLQLYIFLFFIFYFIFLFFNNLIYIRLNKFYEKIPFQKKGYEFSVDEPIGSIDKNTKVEEFYTLQSKNNVRGLELLFATYGRANKGDLKIRVLNVKNNKLIVDKTINQTQIKDNDYVEIIFPHVENDLGNIKILITSSSEKTTSVTMWKSTKVKNSKNTLLINGKKTNGDLIIKELHKPLFVKNIIFLFAGSIIIAIISFILFKIIINLNNIIVFLTSYKILINDLKKYYNLLFEMVIRDIKVKYKKSVLGLLWSVLNPLLMMVVMTIVFSTLFKSDIKNFPIYLLIGQITFSFFSDATNMAMMSIITNGSLLKKVYIPKYIFPASKTIFALVNFLFSLIAIAIVAVFTRQPISIHIIGLPLLIIYMFLFSLGIGLVLSSFAVFFRDLVHLYGILLLVWMYLTPIFYPVRIIPEKFLIFIKLNPMYHYISYFREILLYNRWPSFKMNIICLVFAILSLILGSIVFYRKQNELVLNV